MDMDLMKQVSNFANGNDLVVFWNAFITADPKLKELCACENFSKNLTILDNTVENIGRLCDGDYKKFLEDIISDYAYYGHCNWSHGDDWLIYDSSSGIATYVSFKQANDMIQYILDNVHWYEFKTNDDAILKRFIDYLEKETVK